MFLHMSFFILVWENTSEFLWRVQMQLIIAYARTVLGTCSPYPTLQTTHNLFSSQWATPPTPNQIMKIEWQQQVVAASHPQLPHEICKIPE